MTIAYIFWNEENPCDVCGATSNTSHLESCPNFNIYDAEGHPVPFAEHGTKRLQRAQESIKRAEDDPKAYPWQQKEDGTIAQTLSDMQDTGVSVFTQTAAEWNQKIHDEQNPPQSAEIRTFEQPVIHTGFFGYIKNWLGIV